MELHHVILVSIVQFGLASAKSFRDAPPIFIYPMDLETPQKLVIVGNNSHLPNSILCAAENADNIEWKFNKMSLNAEDFSDILSPFTQTEPSEENGVLTRRLTDSVTEGRQKLNGYYICEASNSYGYKTVTPPIKFIIGFIAANLDHIRPTVQDAPEGGPGRLVCIDYRARIVPDDFRMWNIASFKWRKVLRQNTAQQPIDEDERIRVNPRTGDLYFAYLLESDSTGTSDISAEYQCEMLIRGMSTPRTVGRRRLQILNTTEPTTNYALQSPVETQEKFIKCIEGELCTVTCIYGGRRNGKSPSGHQWEPPSSSVVYDETPSELMVPTSAVFEASADAAGTWTCTHDLDTPSGTVDVTVLSYPSVLPSNMADQFVPVGTNVTFACKVSHSNSVDFYYNGAKIPPGQTTGSVIVDPISKTLSIPNVQRNSSSNVVCMSFNEAGTLYRSAQLSVYSKPDIQLEPVNGYLLKVNLTQLPSYEFPFNCSVTLDPKVEEVDIYWESNHSIWAGQKVKLHHSDGIRAVDSYITNKTSLSSVLTLFIDTQTQNTLPGTLWWCTVEFRLYGAQSWIKINSDKAPFAQEGGGNKGETGQKPKFEDWWIIGVVAAVIFFILLVVLIICCVEQNKGEQYYVDEKERRAGHDPEAELHEYGFKDYKRAATGGYMPIKSSDLEPIPVSRMSLDTSDKPVDSDQGSMEEYGDIDPGRFNEDGSFIGQYGKANGYDV